MEALAEATSRLRRASINAGTALFRIKIHPIEDREERQEHRLDALEAADHPVRELEPSPGPETHGQKFRSALGELNEEYRLLTRPDPPRILSQASWNSPESKLEPLNQTASPIQMAVTEGS